MMTKSPCYINLTSCQVLIFNGMTSNSFDRELLPWSCVFNKFNRAESSVCNVFDNSVLDTLHLDWRFEAQAAHPLQLVENSFNKIHYISLLDMENGDKKIIDTTHFSNVVCSEPETLLVNKVDCVSQYQRCSRRTRHSVSSNIIIVIHLQQNISYS